MSPGTEGAVCDIEVPGGMLWLSHGPVLQALRSRFPGTRIEHCGHRKARIYKEV